MPAKSENRRRPRRRNPSPRPMPREPERELNQEEIETLGTSKGILHVLPDGYGFLCVDGYVASPRDVYVSRSQIQ